MIRKEETTHIFPVIGDSGCRHFFFFLIRLIFFLLSVTHCRYLICVCVSFTLAAHIKHMLMASNVVPQLCMFAYVLCIFISVCVKFYDFGGLLNMLYYHYY